MVGLRSIWSKCASALSLRPTRGLKSHTPGVVLALRSTAQKLVGAARRLFRLLSPRLSYGLARLQRITAVHRWDAIIRPLRSGRVRDFVTRFHPLGVASQGWRTWVADARGFWVMHQEAVGRKRGVEQTKDGDALGSPEKEQEALVRAAEKSLRQVRRGYHRRVEAAARRLSKAQAHKARCSTGGMASFSMKIGYTRPRVLPVSPMGRCRQLFTFRPSSRNPTS